MITHSDRKKLMALRADENHHVVVLMRRSITSTLSIACLPPVLMSFLRPSLQRLTPHRTCLGCAGRTGQPLHAQLDQHLIREAWDLHHSQGSPRVCRLAP